ncbi:hypothetical protein HK414_12555 [Ramlibacter terrae]|uniref:Autotransporter outer membrane beta-barrel domain-containing protein n=1 Tax=Ramlibacter terrae TaxID=2732511 RepID=A0ABX6P2I4_9BURK|nr:hypothetical protein HK414_12555 [Ramlibacter terrae]
MQQPLLGLHWTHARRFTCPLPDGRRPAAAPAAAQRIAPDYTLTTPQLPFDGETAGRTPVASLGPLQLGASASATGNGLSLRAGQQWFARFGVGRSLDTEAISLGGGYRFADGQALSMHVTRQLGQERLGWRCVTTSAAPAAPRLRGAHAQLRRHRRAALLGRHALLTGAGRVIPSRAGPDRA